MNFYQHRNIQYQICFRMSILNFQIVISLNWFVRNAYFMHVHVVLSLHRFLRDEKRD